VRIGPTWSTDGYDHAYRLERDRAMERALEAERALALHGRALREIRAYIDHQLEAPPARSEAQAAMRVKQRAIAVSVLRKIITILNRHEDDLAKNRNAYRPPRWRGTENGPRALPPAA
jgi:hypothetical protein